MVIIYTVEGQANALCNRLSVCKGSKDTAYSVPIEKYNKKKWFVEVLDKDLGHLTQSEFGKRVELPSDWFDLEL